MGKVHLSIDKISKFQSLNPTYNHNLRLWENEYLEHVDKTLSYLNHDLVNVGNIPYADLVKERIRQVSALKGENIRKRKDAVIAYTIVLSFSHGADKDNGFSIEDWEEASLNWLRDYFGTENVVSAMVHLDESNPHIHAIVVPITKDLRLCAKDFTGGRAKMAALQQSYGRAMSIPPFNLEMPTHYGKKGDYEGIKEFYRQINDIEDIKMPVKEQEEELDAYIERLNTYVKKKERRHLSDTKYLKLKLETAYAEMKTFWTTYKPAINLFQYLVGHLGGLNEASEEINKLILLEHMERNKLDEIFSEADKEYKLHGHLVEKQKMVN